MRNTYRATAHRYLAIERRLVHGGQRPRGFYPGVRVSFDDEPTTLDQQHRFPNADGRQEELAAFRGQRGGYLLRQALRLDVAPEPDVRVEQELHSGSPHDTNSPLGNVMSPTS